MYNTVTLQKIERYFQDGSSMMYCTSFQGFELIDIFGGCYLCHGQNMVYCIMMLYCLWSSGIEHPNIRGCYIPNWTWIDYSYPPQETNPFWLWHSRASSLWRKVSMTRSSGIKSLSFNNGWPWKCQKLYPSLGIYDNI